MAFMYVILILIGVSGEVYASDAQKFSEFITEMVEKKNVRGCKKLISNLFNGKGGDARVNVSTYPGEKNVIQITVTHGKKGDSVMYNVFMRKLGNKCIANIITTIASPESCMSYVNKNKNLNFISENADYAWLDNGRGVTVQAKPVENSCLITILSDASEEWTA